MFSLPQKLGTSFNRTGVLSPKLCFLKSVFIHPNKIKNVETTFEKVNTGLAENNVWPNTNLVFPFLFPELKFCSNSPSWEKAEALALKNSLESVTLS
ncbi:hypothetical protein MTR_8g464750 [Medicago truncatula]|uniref:Uncharacterized protein n=1 Tax=Medicago truncatula TaxID=3880 RepID=A0A072U1B9_MEDTR|nr:hypothetical protein MTR_8g464750 [Medicago truncatula]